MTLSTYSDLSAAIVDFMQDSNQSTKVDTYIALAEARFNRVLDTPDQQSSTTLDGSTTSIALPSDYYEVRGLYLNGQYTLPLEALTMNALKALYPDNLSGVPVAYAVDGPNIILGPLPNATCTLKLNYKQKIQGLSATNTTNWLLTKHPDLYLLGCLVAAELRGWNDGRLPMLKAAVDEMIEEINEAGKKAKIASGPLRMRAVITETGRSAGGDSGNLLTDGTNFLVDG
jgi:hypothetical protein